MGRTLAQKLAASSERIKAAEAAQLALLRKHFPVNCRVRVKVQSGNLRSVGATVWGHSSNIYDGYVVVRLDTAKQRSRQACRSLPVDQITEVFL